MSIHRNLGSRYARRFLLACLALLFFAPVSLWAQAKSDDEATIVYVSQNSPAQGLARTIEQAFGKKGAKAVPTESSNCIIITAPEGTLREITKMLPQLDRAPRQLSIEVALVELSSEQLAGIGKLKQDAAAAEVVELAKKGAASVSRFKLSTLENQPALVQVGQMKSIPTGRSRISPTRNPTGRFSTSTWTNREFGTIVQVTGTSNDKNELTLSLEFESSRFVEPKPVAAPAPAPEGATEPPEFRPGYTVTARIQSTIRVANGKPTLLNVVEQSGLADGRHFVLLTTANVQGQNNAVAKKGDKPTLRVYHLKNTTADSASKVAVDLVDNPKTTVRADPRTNSILVTSSNEDDLDRIEALLRVLDADIDRAKKPKTP